MPEGWFKYEVDVAFFTDTNSTGIRTIIKKFVGEFVASKAFTIPGRMRVEEGEILGIYEALSWMKKFGLTHVQVETDCKVAFDVVIVSNLDNIEFGSISSNCK